MSDKDNRQTRRRTVLGLAAAGASGLVAACKKKWKPASKDPFSRALAKPDVPGARDWSTHEERWANTTCGQCPAGCGVRVRVVEGRAVRIEGNPKNPLNQGGVGPRGLAGLQVLYDPDRITGPRVRRGGELVAVGWDEAIDAAVAALKKATDGRLLIMSGRERGMTNDLLRRLCGLAGGHFIDGRASHSGPIARAMLETFGVGEIPSYDWAGARTVLSLEAGLLEDSCQAVYFTRMAAEHRGRERARIVHAGSAFDLSAYNADDFVQLRPGTSGALALGLCHVLLADGTYDRANVDRAGNRAGFETLAKQFSPARVSEITGAPAAAIEKLARALWREQPSFALIDERSVGFENGLHSARAALALNLLLGAIEAPHGGVRLPIEPPLRSWPAASQTIREHDQYADVLELIEGANPPSAALLYYTNPIFSRAHPERWRAGLERVETVVSFSPILDETTAAHAAVVLPDHSYLERREDAGAAPGLPRSVVGVRQPVVEPLHDTRATGDVALEIARRLGGPVAAAMPWLRFSDAVDQRLLGLHDAGRGSVKASSERAFLAELYDAGVWADSAPPPPRPFEVKLPDAWREPSWSGEAGGFPLELFVYRPLGQTIGGGANLPWLHQLRSRPGDRAWTRFARVHPDSAAGIADGDEIVITSRRGSITMPVRLDHRLVPGVITAPIGGGHTEMGRFARGLGVNPLTLLETDALCGTRVKIARAT